MQVTSIDIQKGQRIDSLQALRALAFLGIFFEHAHFCICWPTLGVSIFFVMSGFLMTKRYENVELIPSPKNCFFFSLKKIMKLYPLHIITMLCAAVLSAARIVNNNLSLRAIAGLANKIIFNAALLQTWFPDCTVSISLNEPAWFLSAAMFLYFMFPWLKKIINRYSTVELCILCVIVLLVQTISCVLFLDFLGDRKTVYIWFMYSFPVFRLGDFFIGCVIKRVFYEHNIKSIGTIKATVYELLATALTVLVFFWCAEEHDNIVLKALSNWTTPYILLAAVWVMLFAAKRGLLTRLLCNKMTIAVGNISAYAFLIHFVITLYTPYLLAQMNIADTGWRSAVIVLAELAVSIALSVCYKHFDKKIISKYLFTAHGRKAD